MTTTVRELAFIESLTRGLSRSPLQLNALQESDAELLRLGPDSLLAITTDTIAEEIRAGLYADPWLAGWMSVMVNFSDIAAVGGEPQGILIAQTFPAEMDDESRKRLQAGIQDACTACGSYVLGGDTNQGDHLQITGTAIGTIVNGRPMMRRGIRPGDLIYSTGPMGRGNAFAAALLAGLPFLPSFQPIARLREGLEIRKIAGACMDSSDGLLATLDQLGRINDVGFDLSPRWQDDLDLSALHCARDMNIPPWIFLAGPHGEFELVFSIKNESAPPAGQMLTTGGMPCVYLGRAIQERQIRLPGVGTFSPDHLADIRNLEPPDGESLPEYLKELMALGSAAGESTPS
jgi:thiamine-monophosphate kinase